MKPTPLYKFFWALIGIFTPIKNIAILVLVFVAIDMVTGIWASLKRGEHFESGKVWKTIYKLFFAELSVLMAFLLDKYIMPWPIYLPNCFAALICGAELWSFLENAGYISGHPIFRKLIKMSKKKINHTIDESLENTNGHYDGGDRFNGMQSTKKTDPYSIPPSEPDQFTHEGNFGRPPDTRAPDRYGDPT